MTYNHFWNIFLIKEQNIFIIELNYISSCSFKRIHLERFHETLSSSKWYVKRGRLSTYSKIPVDFKSSFYKIYHVFSNINYADTKTDVIRII